MEKKIIKQEKQKRDLKKGFKVEDVFASLMMKTGKFKTLIEADKKSEDIYAHWDRGFITNKDKRFLVDVKGIKKYGDEYHTIELLNNLGGIGWMFGKADYIAFELSDRFVGVDRLKLLEFTLNKLFNDKEKVKNIINNLHSRKVLLNLRQDLLNETGLLTKDGTSVEDKVYKKFSRKEYGNSDITTVILKQDILDLKDFQILKNNHDFN